jgi:hypothetical protein
VSEGRGNTKNQKTKKKKKHTYFSGLTFTLSMLDRRPLRTNEANIVVNTITINNKNNHIECENRERKKETGELQAHEEQQSHKRAQCSAEHAPGVGVDRHEERVAARIERVVAETPKLDPLKRVQQPLVVRAQLPPAVGARRGQVKGARNVPKIPPLLRHAKPAVAAHNLGLSRIRFI